MKTVGKKTKRSVISECEFAFKSLSKDKVYDKDKVYLMTNHEGPVREQLYNATLSSTSALDGGGWSTPLSGRFTLGKDPVPIVWEAG
jgi:hypothetical protein